MKDNLTKLYEAVKQFAKERGENYISVRITRTADFYSDKPTPDIYEGYIHGYSWHSGITIAEVIQGLKDTDAPPPKTPEQKQQEDIDLPF